MFSTVGDVMAYHPVRLFVSAGNNLSRGLC
jgi:hypothetical protein